MNQNRLQEMTELNSQFEEILDCSFSIDDGIVLGGLEMDNGLTSLSFIHKMEELHKDIATNDNILGGFEVGKTEVIQVGGGNGQSDHHIFIVYLNDTSDIVSATEQISNYKEKDMLIIINDEKETAGYVFTNNFGWLAFSGNVSAKNVVFTKDILLAGDYSQVGNITKSATSTATLPAKGKTVEELMTSIFTKELQPMKAEPAVSISFPQAGAKEVGTMVTPSYSLSLSAGSYTYGPATGVKATGYSVTDSAGNTSTDAAASFPSFVVEDSTRYTISATIDHNEGTIAQSNIGNNSNPIVRIEAGSKSKTSSAVTGYRNTYYGILNHDNALDSAAVRGMTSAGAAAAKKITVKVNGKTDALRIVLALPSAKKLKITNVMKTDGLATDITSQYSKIGTVQVDGCNSHNLMADYDIWVYKPASIDAAEIHEITIA